MRRLRDGRLLLLLTVVAFVVVVLPAPTVLRAPATIIALGLLGVGSSLALVPGRDVGWPVRLASALALALTAMILVSLAIQVSPWALDRASWAVGLYIWGAAAWVIAIRRAPERSGEVASDRPTVLPWLAPRSLLLTLLLVVVLIAVAGVARRPLPPPDGVGGYTQLWLVPGEENGELGLASFELEPTSYRLELWSGGDLAEMWNLTLRPGESWTVAVAPTAREVEARLFRGTDTQPYRTVRSPVRAGTG